MYSKRFGKETIMLRLPPPKHPNAEDVLYNVTIQEIYPCIWHATDPLSTKDDKKCCGF